MTTAAPTQEAAYLDASRRLAAAEPLPSFAARLRERGAERFAALGFPTARRGNEYWKYTDVAPIARGAFALPERPSPTPPPPLIVEGAAVATLTDGFVASAPGAIGGGAYAGSLRGAPAAALKAAERALGAAADFEGEAFAALNAALMQDVFVLYAPAGARLAAPIHLAVTTAPGAASQPRALIVCERGAEASVIISHAGEAGAPYFANTVTEVALAADARLRLFHARNHPANALHVETTAARLDRDAAMRSFVLDQGAGLVRHNLNVALAEPGASADAAGVSVTGVRAHLDNHLFLHHESAETHSSALYKGVALGASRTVFVGRVLVPQNSQRISTRLTNKSLLLSPGAEVDSQPLLEIYADDIAATHGSAVGQLDEEALFYLNSRGIGAETATAMLVNGFLAEAVALLDSAPLAAYAEAAVRAALPEGAGA